MSSAYRKTSRPISVGTSDLPGADEQFLAHLLLQAAELRADGGRRQAQLLAGLRDAARAHDFPEVEQMMVVEPFHGCHLYIRRDERSIP